MHDSARRAGVSSLEVQSRVQAIEVIARQCLAEMRSTSEWDIEAHMVTQLVRWILRELYAVHEARD